MARAFGEVQGVVTAAKRSVVEHGTGCPIQPARAATDGLSSGRAAVDEEALENRRREREEPDVAIVSLARPNSGRPASDVESRSRDRASHAAALASDMLSRCH